MQRFHGVVAKSTSDQFINMHLEFKLHNDCVVKLTNSRAKAGPMSAASVVAVVGAVGPGKFYALALSLILKLTYPELIRAA